MRFSAWEAWLQDCQLRNTGCVLARNLRIEYRRCIRTGMWKDLHTATNTAMTRMGMRGTRTHR